MLAIRITKPTLILAVCLLALNVLAHEQHGEDSVGQLQRLKSEAEENYELFKNGPAFDALVRYARLKHQLMLDSTTSGLNEWALLFNDSIVNQQNRYLKTSQAVSNIKSQLDSQKSEKARLFRNAAIYFLLISSAGILILFVVKKKKKAVESAAQHSMQTWQYIEEYNSRASRFENAIKDVRFSFNSITEIGMQMADQLEKLRSLCVTLNIHQPELVSSTELSSHLSAAASTALESIDHFKTFFSDEETGSQLKNLNPLLDDMLHLSYLWIKSEWPEFNCRIHKDLEKILPDFGFQPAALRIAFFHLMSNAFQSAAEKWAEGQSGYIPQITVTSRKLPRFIQVRIRDNGNGLDVKQASLIFNEFFTVRSKPFNTGLGLAEAYRILHDLHKAEVIVESDVKSGTDFLIKFPFNR